MTGNQDATQNQGTGNTQAGATQAAGEKLFTQAELDAKIGERLARERKKFGDANVDELLEKAKKYDELEAANKTELEKATEEKLKLQAQLDALKKEGELRTMRESVAKETGVPVNLLTASTEEDCKAQAEAIKAYANPGYPNVKDGGEVNTQGKTSTRDQFAEWMNKL